MRISESWSLDLALSKEDYDLSQFQHMVIRLYTNILQETLQMRNSSFGGS